MTGREPPTHQGIRDTIQREHECLRGLLTQLAGARELAALVPMMERLREELVEHFATEERPDGLHAAIENREPRFERALHVILEEHHVVLAEAASILERARECLARKEEILVDVQRFTEKLHDHEQRETQLLADTMYIDLGRSS